MELRLLRNEESLVRIEVCGKISRDGWSAREDPLTELCGEGIYGHVLLVNLARAMHVDSTGVEWLLASHKKCTDQGGRLILHSANRMILQMLNVMRMDLVLNIADTEENARTLAKEHKNESVQ